jgi:Tfp pilus assembly protein PilO
MKTIYTLLAILALSFGAWFGLESRVEKCVAQEKQERQADMTTVKDSIKSLAHTLKLNSERGQLDKMESKQMDLEEKYPDMSKTPTETQRRHKELGAGLERQKAVVDKLEGGN